jgi:hypothetical protein
MLPIGITRYSLLIVKPAEAAAIAPTAAPPCATSTRTSRPAG